MKIKDEKAENRSPVILFADDDKYCLDISVQMLKRLGYGVLQAKNGQEAVEVYRNNQDSVDLVILDMKMPHNGAIAFDELRRINSDLRIILTSGFTEDYRIREMVKQGCKGFLQKPFDLKLLSQKIRDALKN